MDNKWLALLLTSLLYAAAENDKLSPIPFITYHQKLTNGPNFHSTIRTSARHRPSGQSDYSQS